MRVEAFVNALGGAAATTTSTSSTTTTTQSLLCTFDSRAKCGEWMSTRRAPRARMAKLEVKWRCYGKPMYERGEIVFCVGETRLKAQLKR
jgi:hypothetical protein